MSDDTDKIERQCAKLENMGVNPKEVRVILRAADRARLEIAELKPINLTLSKQVVRMTLAIQEHKDSFDSEGGTTEDETLWEVLE